jgi:hypothetical protein
MCDLATASLVATGLGTAASYEAGQQSKNAMSKAQQAENERQKKMRGQANELFNESLGTEGQGNAVRSEDKAIQDRQDAAKAAMATGTGVDSGSAYGNKSTVVSDESGVRSAAGKASAGMEAAAKARMAGFGDAAQLNAIKNARMRLGQGIISGNMAGSAAALAPELDYASHAGDSMKNLGAGLSTVGMLTGMAAAAGAGATTAEELAKAQSGGGAITNAEGNTLYPTSDGGYSEYNSTTGSLTPYKGDFTNYVSKSHLDWANKPAFMKMFGNAPAGYVAAPSWFSKIK